MMPLLLFDRSRLVKISGNIKTSTNGEKMETITIRLLRSHIKKAVSGISINASFNSDPKLRYFTHSFRRALFKNYLMINAIHIIVQAIQVIVVSIFLDFKADFTNLTSIESDILPHRVICILFSNNMRQQNIDIYQCTLPSQYRIGRTFIILICYMIIIICCNIICLIRSVYSSDSRSQRQNVWLPYCPVQSVVQLDDVQP
jgi:hypothetical protein